MESPFTQDLLDEVPLQGGPLVRVIAQVRFPRVFDFEQPETLRLLRIGLADAYPVANVGKSAQITFGPEGVTQGEPQAVLRCQSIDGAWQVSITESFVSLDTGAYASRSDFSARLLSILQVVFASMTPPIIERIGVRYINRICAPDLREKLTRWIQPELHTGVSVPLGDAKLLHSFSESLFEYNDSRLFARWGWLPAGAVPDASVPPVGDVSWQLDLDAFSEGRFAPNAVTVAEETAKLAELGHRFFRRTTTKQLLDDLGGQR
jgi:uncharacterized protein (TIGR04255 family)